MSLDAMRQLWDADLSSWSAAKLVVALRVADRAGNDSVARLGVDHLVADTSRCKNAVLTALRQLAAEGVIEKLGRGRGYRWIGLAKARSMDPEGAIHAPTNVVQIEHRRRDPRASEARSTDLESAIGAPTTNTTNNHKPLVPQEAAAPSAATDEPKPRRAVRLCADAPLTEEFRAEGARVAPQVDLDYEWAQLRDWSRSSPNGAKLDWLATWRNWVRRRQNERRQVQTRFKPERSQPQSLGWADAHRKRG